jgi:hypothetical protein
MEEIAGLLSAVSAALDDAITVNLATNPLYSRRYDFEFDLRGRWSLYRRIRRLASGPWVLGQLAATRKTFIYLGGEGFLLSLVDGREREFAFLRARQRTVVCYFTGSDIRSYELLDEFGRRHDRDVLTTYEPLVVPAIATKTAERHRRNLARAADLHANVLINSAVDQMSYFQRRTERALYFYPDELVSRRPAKWRDLSRLVVLHAPTSPVIKGTQLVRAAVKALKSEGYAFDYVELSGKPHEQVLEALQDAHIVMNHFYQFIPTILGLEAMSANAVLMASADPAIETDLAPGADEAWVVTPYWRVYHNLRALLDDPASLQAQADRGTEWVAQNCTRTVDRARLLDLIRAAEASLPTPKK